MELRELRAFEAIVEEGSFRAAADRLYQTPSALSHQIARLEREFPATAGAGDFRRLSDDRG
jgi:DNA-binding transcriptional LysR family regulator